MGSAEEPETPERPWWKRLYDAARRGADALKPFMPVLTLLVTVASLLRG
ncbi:MULTISPECIES: hypothetical protein [unclassified Streptomyces]